MIKAFTEFLSEVAPMLVAMAAVVFSAILAVKFMGELMELNQRIKVLEDKAGIERPAQLPTGE